MNEVPSASHDHLNMLDEFGHRKFIIPAEVKGYFHKRKKMVHFILLVIFLILPWIRVGGHQALLLDIPGRHFVFFGLSLYSHDAPLIFFVLAILVLSLALATALWGRVWCGWACPQTVFIESVYREIEIRVEGTYIERRRRQAGPWAAEKVLRSLIKWGLYFFVSALIAHSFLAYFVGGDRLLSMMGGAPSENWVYFVLVFAMTGVLMFNFGWFREQFCLIMCPYGRLQSVLLDSHSLTVMYDEKRGEPRKGKTEAGRGDCVACNRCVQVCPTGIDIRNGIQFECIGCTACIDACDEIMAKVKKPPGLISYRALTSKKIQWLRPRILIYGVLLFLSSAALAALLSTKRDFRVEILRGKGEPYRILESTIENHFDVRIENDSDRRAEFKLSLSPDSGRYFEILMPEREIGVDPGTRRDLPMFVLVRKENYGLAPSSLRIRLQKREADLIEREIPFVGPLKELSR